MTEHPFPATDMPAAAVHRTRRGRLKMMLVLLACAAPVIASYVTYYVIKPEGRRNFGELVEPQRPIPDLTGETLDGAKQRLTALRGQWLLVHVDSAACASACELKLYLQRQLRESLGKDKERVDRVWLVDDALPVREDLQPALQGVTVLRLPREAIAQWLQPTEGQALADHLYVVDPLGNWMMRFPAHLDVKRASRAKKDLDRLMRGSAFWDQPGRGAQEGH